LQNRLAKKTQQWPMVPLYLDDSANRQAEIAAYRVMAISKLLAATDRKVSPRLLWQRQTFSTNG
jgi:hypothetical protein